MEVPLQPCAPVSTTEVGRRILDAATQLFRQQGITATGVDRIVELAGTTKRTLYQRFGSKDHLVACYLQHRAHRWQSELVAALEDANPADGLDVVYDHAIRWAAQGSRGCAFVNAWAEIGASDHPGVAVIRTEKDWMLTLFIQLADSDPHRGCRLHLLYEGAQVQASIQEDSAAFTEARHASHELLSSKP